MSKGGKTVTAGEFSPNDKMVAALREAGVTVEPVEGSPGRYIARGPDGTAHPFGPLSGNDLEYNFNMSN